MAVIQLELAHQGDTHAESINIQYIFRMVLRYMLEFLRLCHKLATSLPHQSKRIDKFQNRALVKRARIVYRVTQSLLICWCHSIATHVIAYSSFIVTISLSCTVYDFRILMLIFVHCCSGFRMFLLQNQKRYKLHRDVLAHSVFTYLLAYQSTPYHQTTEQPIQSVDKLMNDTRSKIITVAAETWEEDGDAADIVVLSEVN